jgi:Asp-tRNA(Asn)/Glu-tRNA(Gln) amidotransferase A subunit family amidase
MKPTWGLVPYTGIMPIEVFIDHTGPITASVADNALLLEVLAGDDGYDSRARSKPGSPKPSLSIPILMSFAPRPSICV